MGSNHETDSDVSDNDSETDTEDLKYFQKWSGDDGIENFIIKKTGCKPFSGAGINYRKTEKTTILRSVDNTFYYDDNLDDSNNVKYTLFGQIGNQDKKEKRFNEPLLNPEKTKYIYLYRVTCNKKNKYIWYGKYKIKKINEKKHIDKENNDRIIYVLSLIKQ